MKDTRLLKLIKTFTKEELKSFEKFLQSPFLKPARDTSDLYYYIIKFFPDYETSKLEKEKIFAKIFKGESYNEKKILNLIFELTKAAEDFLAFNTIMNDEVEFLLNLSKGYIEKNLSDESNRVNRLIEKKLKPALSPGKDYISKFRRLNYLKSIFFMENHDYENYLMGVKKYFETSAVQFIIDYTEIVGSIGPAMNTYGINIKSKFIESVIQSFDLEKILEVLEKSEFENKHMILLHYYLLKTNLEPENKLHYEMLRDLFYELLPSFEREDKCTIFNQLTNYCTRKNNKEFLAEGLKVYKAMLENDAYSVSENEYMQIPLYRNIIQFCISLEETEWFEFFIDNYSKFLHPEHRKDLRNYSFAYLYFIKKEFDKSLESVSEINQELFLFKPDLRNLMLKIYYEVNYIEPAFSLVDSYKHFLSNTNEVTNSFKEKYTKFLNFYFQLLKIKIKQSKEHPSYYKEMIEKEKELINKIWLLEKAEELIKKK